MNRLTKPLARLRGQVDASPWLRWALLAIGLLAAVLVLQELERFRIAAQEASIQQESRLRQMRSLQGQDVWFEREKSASNALESLLVQIPPAPTPGVAQAALQGWLAELGNGISDTQSVRIAVEPAAPVESVPGVLRIRATLRAGMTPREALNIVRRIESGTNLVVIESLDIRSDTNRMASFGMSAYYRLQSSPGTAAPEDAQ